MSNKLKKDLTNAKARFKAASKRLEKLESSGDNQAIAEAQVKLDKEQEIIDSIEKQLATREAVDYDEPKSFKEIIALANTQETDFEDSCSTRRSKDNPQVSFRTDEVIYQRLKEHIKSPDSKHLKPYLSMADMSRTLNLSDLYCDLYFIIHRTKQQLARFIELSRKDPSELTMEDQEILRSQYRSYYTDTDEEKAQLIETMQELHDYINSLAILYRY
ncbi:MAG TPA: hypothetical protein ACFCUY_02430 [Xenococcaceae cyanobacterium]|jgi:hypothetical protein